MKFAELIREAGFKPEDFPKASEISVTLYDGKNRTVVQETIHFVEELFAHNDDSHKRFSSFLRTLEKENITSMKARLDVSSIAFYFGTSKFKIFPR